MTDCSQATDILGLSGASENLSLIPKLSFLAHFWISMHVSGHLHTLVFNDLSEKITKGLEHASGQRPGEFKKSTFHAHVYSGRQKLFVSWDTLPRSVRPVPSVVSRPCRSPVRSFRPVRPVPSSPGHPARPSPYVRPVRPIRPSETNPKRLSMRATALGMGCKDIFHRR